MEEVRCLYDNKYVREYAYNVNDFDYNIKYDVIKKSKSKKEYITTPITFDIETCTIKNDYKSLKEDRDIYEGFMYHWQVCVNGAVIFGRTWKQFQFFIEKLKQAYGLNENKILVCYVHNLSYEFQFLYRFFQVSDVFATDTHKVLRATIDSCIELRCSYYLSNMSLEKFIENTENTHHNKGKGDLDYRKLFTPNSHLSTIEKGYCYNDVLGLYECLISKLKEDDILTIPMTSTGYVRRDCRNAMRKNKANRMKFEKSALDLDTYELLKECFRGGNTASNRYMTNFILNDVSSYDISSSYPYVMLSEKYPVGKFMQYSIDSIDELEKYNRQYCTIGTYIFKNVRIKKGIPIPYIPFSKCNYCDKGSTIYNGRVLYSDALVISLTNIDFDIIKNQYDFEELYVEKFYFSRKDYLPQELRDIILEYFYKKSLLKGDEKHYYEYMKSKNKLNGIYGMTVTDILHDIFSFDYETGDFVKTKEHDIEKYYSNRNNFLSYQWGVFVTAYARRNLQNAVDKIGLDVVYVDTDSVKYINDHDDFFESNNKVIINNNLKLHIKHYVDIKNERYYLGLFDKEPTYDRFITLGAKKYAYEINGKLGVTVSGLNKKQGADELKEKGGLEFFRDGEVFYNSGRTVAQYNNDDIHIINVNGVEIENGSNIAIVDTRYTLGMTDTMKSILDTLEV